jgi:Protein of unknown function (DUF2934)
MFDFERTDASAARSPEADFGRCAAMPPEPPLGDPAAAGAGAAPDALDLWLRRGLHRLYSAVAAEPIPPELLWLIEGRPGQSARRAEVPASPPWSGLGISDARRGFERRVRERAYFLWLEEDCPQGRALEHWMLAFTRQVAQETHERHEVGQEAVAAARHLIEAGACALPCFSLHGTRDGDMS